ncbi:MAG: polysaccharide deacetylase family protein [Hyphomicrobiaceae bacterium]|nr:polysaccharide deacetylase family protein [Hyphomicrobiaceae bacterium]MCC0010109.1 polysaccharide deacetylase family protein [Hyphomicrobiaceae bacterium]
MLYKVKIFATALALAMSFGGLAAPSVRAADIQTGEACKSDDGGLKVSRVIEIDTSSGPLFGAITKQVKEANFLHPKEVVLTFDDGPMPWVTGPILDILDEFCTKATFFSVGKMAMAYPATLRKIIARGHTLGGHTWSHPLNLKRLSQASAMLEIEKGFAAISLASGGQAAPFFRFPGLSDNGRMLSALQKRGIASFSVDVVSDDSYISNPAKLVATTLSRVDAHKGGILLFHDIKPATAKALPSILRALKRRGYKVVHMRPKRQLEPLANLSAQLQPILAKKDPPQGQAVARAAMLPFFGTIGPERIKPANERAVTGSAAIAVEELAPPPRDRSGNDKSKKTDSKGASKHDRTTPPTPQRRDEGKSHKHAQQVPAEATGEHAVVLRSSLPASLDWPAQVQRPHMKTYFD